MGICIIFLIEWEVAEGHVQFQRGSWAGGCMLDSVLRFWSM